MNDLTPEEQKIVDTLRLEPEPAKPPEPPRRVQALDEITTKPVGESSPFHDFVAAQDGADRLENETVDVTRDFLPSTARRDALLDQIRAAVPFLSERQRVILSALSQEQTIRQIAGSLGVSKALVQKEIYAARKIISEKGCTNADSRP